jgi:hypothetical protein
MSMHTVHTVEKIDGREVFQPVQSKGQIRRFDDWTAANDHRDRLRGKRRRMTAQIVEGLGRKAKDVERFEAILSLLDSVKPGDTIHTTLEHCSRSGMYRAIGLYKLLKGDRLFLSYNAALATSNRYDRKHEGMAMGGCGMDMGFAAVYELAYNLFPGWVGQSERMGNTAGYSLNHRWM